MHLGGDGCGGAWSVRDISAYLERLTAWQQRYARLPYNEWVVGPPDAWERQLPDLIEAFFVSRRAAPEVRANARAWHADFVAAYPKQAAEVVPLVELDQHNWTHPFS